MTNHRRCPWPSPRPSSRRRGSRERSAALSVLPIVVALGGLPSKRRPGTSLSDYAPRAPPLRSMVGVLSAAPPLATASANAAGRMNHAVKHNPRRRRRRSWGGGMRSASPRSCTTSATSSRFRPERHRDTRARLPRHPHRDTANRRRQHQGAEAVVTSTSMKGDNPPRGDRRAPQRVPVVPRAVHGWPELMRLKQGIAIAARHGGRRPPLARHQRGSPRPASTRPS